MIDEQGELINLDQVDAISAGRGGVYDVWLSDVTRTLTREADAFDTWLRHIKATASKTQKLGPTPVSLFVRIRSRYEKGIELNNVVKELSVIAQSDSYLVTRTRIEYDRLLNAKLNGHGPDDVYLTRRGLWLNRKQIIPPDTVLFN